jgi:hypothetical protein
VPSLAALAPRLVQIPGPMPTPCLVWTGRLNEDGYGVVDYRRIEDDAPARALAHRLYYRLTRGPLTKGMVLDHTCRQRNCVLHTEEITQAENVRRGDSPHGINYRKERCSRGHEPRWGQRKSGRYCRECLKEDAKALRDRRRKALTQ